MARKASRKVAKENIDLDSDDNADICWWLSQKGLAPLFTCISILGLLVRLTVALHSYSGAGNPPKFGDYEAQRHWMEITINLPAQSWYLNSTENDLSYWGLDYPPLTAYQSYVHGLYLRFFEPNSVSLLTSHGYESYIGKILMRWTVLSSDLLIFFPAVLCFLHAYYGLQSNRRTVDVAQHIVIILINPCLILIDHGHFQYNCISLGLALAAVAAILSQKDLIACALFCLSLNHKQMSAYFAPAFFSHLLGKCLRRKHPLLEISKLGLVVLGTFAIVWWPYLHSKDAALQVLSRLAPFDRGIYEDYVANFWCTSSVVIKWKRLFPTSSLRLFSLVATILACLPSMIQQMLAPSSKGFLYGLLNSSLSFYLFSFQVHEKSILLPLLPATLLAMEFPDQFKSLLHYAMFSMFPLIRRDNLVLPYVALYALCIFLYNVPDGRWDAKRQRSTAFVTAVLIFSYLCSLVLHVVYLTVNPPERYPFLYEALIMLLCFSQFVLFAFRSNKKQWMLSGHLDISDVGKKKQ
ncbi:Probable dolichyl pyrophosphate Man9GlcNAc2 alpha-1,3-glucosyltransferase [Linum perenne]